MTARRRTRGHVWNRVLPPPYRRRRLPGPVEKRPVWYRNRLHEVAAEALAAGELPLQAFGLLMVLLPHSNAHGGDVYGLTLTQWGAAAGDMSPGYAQKWARWLFLAGWLDKEHVCVTDRKSGRWRGRPNVWRLLVPTARAALFTTARKVAAGIRPSSRPSSAAGPVPRNLAAEFTAAVIAGAVTPPPEPTPAEADRQTELQARIARLAEDARQREADAGARDP